MDFDLFERRWWDQQILGGGKAMVRRHQKHTTFEFCQPL